MAETPIPTTGIEPGPPPITPVDLYDRPWMQSVLRPLLIAIMAGCLVLALLAFIRRLAPDLPAFYTQLLVVVGMAASAIGSITTTWLAQPGQRGKRNIGYRAAELALILMVTRVSIWLVEGAWPGIEQFFVRPVDSLLDGYFLAGLLVVFLAWVMSTSMTEDLLAMALQPDDLYMTRTFGDRWQDTARPVYTDRPAILRRFVARWVAGGILLILLAAGSRLELPEKGFLGIIRQHIDPTVITAIIVYFLLGLVLISQGQLALQRARWTLQKTPSAASVLRNWPVYALGLILLVGVVAALMPLGGTFWLAQILTTIITTVYFVLFGIFRFFLSLFLLLVSWLTGEPAETPPLPPPPQQAAMPETLPAAESTLPPWAGGAVFWLLTALLLGYAAYIYFSGKGFTFAWARQLWQMLRERWQQLFGAYQGWQAERLRAALARNQAQGQSAARGLPGWLRLRNLDPQRQIRYYYLSILHHAGQAGLPRQESETPLHYAPRLAARLEADEAGQEAIRELTEAFIDVRYAGDAVPPARLAQTKAVWEQIKRLLRL